jgi:hypothetical protein
VQVFPRDVLSVVGRRDPVGAEQQVLYAGHVVVDCTVSGRPVALAMSAEALTGLLAWLEAAPPGRGPRPR